MNLLNLTFGQLLALFGAWIGPLASSAARFFFDQLPKISATFTIVVALPIIISVIPSFRAWLGAAPLRRAAPRRRLSPEDWRIRKALYRELKALLNGTESTAAEISWRVASPVASGVATAPGVAAYQRMALLHGVVERALRPRSQGTMVRYLASQAWELYRARLELLREYLEQFASMTVVRSDDIARLKSDDSSVGCARFSDFASAFSGASVILDAAQVHSGVGAGVTVLHVPEWDGPEGFHGVSGKRHGNPYEKEHDLTTLPVAGRVKDRVAGQYDGRVPTLAGVELVERPGLSGTQFLVTTREVCYAATDPSAESTDPDEMVADPARSLPCKGLSPANIDANLRMLRRSEEHDGYARESFQIERAGGGVPSRAVLLNVVLALICSSGRDDDSSGSLALTRRSAHVRHAAHGLAPTSGGVIELAMRDHLRDSDRFGAVVPLHGVRREMYEELGLDADAVVMTPQAVYLTTVRNEPRSDKLNTGQLVASILYIGHTDLTIEGLRACARRADPIEGAFEWERIIGVPLGPRAEHFARNLSERIRDESGSRSAFDQLEQSAVLSALYASARTFGPAETITAFKSVFKAPWWADPWPISEGGQSRLCRPPMIWTNPSDPWVAARERIMRFWPEASTAAVQSIVDGATRRINVDAERIEDTARDRRNERHPRREKERARRAAEYARVAFAEVWFKDVINRLAERDTDDPELPSH